MNLQCVNEKDFKQALRQTHIVCSPEFGVYLNFEKTLPIHFEELSFEENAHFFIAEFSSGKMLHVIEGEKITLKAFEIIKKEEAC